MKKESNIMIFKGVCGFVADHGRSTADCRQGGVRENLGGGALQRRLGPHGPAHVLGHAHAGRLLPHHPRFRGAAREGVAELRSPLPAGKQTFMYLVGNHQRYLSSCTTDSLYSSVLSLSASVMGIRTTQTQTAHLFSFSSSTVCGS